MAKGSYSPTIFNGDFVKTLKDSLKLGENVKIITGDSDDPTSVSKDAPIGSLYFRDTTSEIYKKEDAGSSTNWILLTDHGSLSGLSDDDHSQYALLAGRPGDTILVDDIDEKTVDHGVEIDGVLLKDTDVEADEIRTDDINEKTVDHGVEIDGVVIKDGGITLNTGATCNDINDEDDMSSDSATALATQQSIKAYADKDVIVSKSTTYTAVATDKIIKCDSSGGAFTITLYAASGNAGRRLIFIKTSSDYNAITIDGNASETINGNLTSSINTQWERLELICDGTNWLVVKRDCNTSWVNDGVITITGSSANPTKGTTSVDKAWYRRVGDSVEVRLEYAQAGGSPGGGTGDYLIEIPNSLVIDTTKVQTYTTILGQGNARPDNSVGFARISITDNAADGAVSVYDTTNVRIHLISSNDATSNPIGTFSATFYSLSEDPLTIAASFTVPISGWKGENE